VGGPLGGPDGFAEASATASAAGILVTLGIMSSVIGTSAPNMS